MDKHHKNTVSDKKNTIINTMENTIKNTMKTQIE
jgi:hypothetical protein